MGRNCFVIMPFHAAFDGVWTHVIRPTVLAAGDQCARADDIYAPGVIMHDVLNSITNSDYLIADLTGRNPNVFYELGLAHAQSKKVILVVQDITDVPFDLRHWRILQYNDTVAGAAALRAALATAIACL